MTTEQLFEPMTIILSRDKYGRRFATTSGMKRSTKVKLSKNEWNELRAWLDANPDNTFEVWAAFQAKRQGKANITTMPDGSIRVITTDTVDL